MSFGFRFLVFIFTETLSLILIALFVPESSLLHSFADKLNVSLGLLSISVTVEPVSCKAQVFTDLPVSWLISVTLTIGSKPLLAYYKSYSTFVAHLFCYLPFVHVTDGCAFCHSH